MSATEEIARFDRYSKFARLSRAVDAAVRAKRDLKSAYEELEKANEAAPDFGENVNETETLQDARAILITRVR